MKTSDFAKLLRRVGDQADIGHGLGCMFAEIEADVKAHPERYRKGLQRVALKPEMTAGEIRDALVTIKLFLVQPMMFKHLDTILQNRAQIAMNRLWNAMLPDFAVEVGEKMLDEGYEPRVSEEKPRGITS